MAFRCLPAAAALFFSIASFTAAASPFPEEADRLLATARLWATVDYFHPYLAHRDVDWDGALVRALPAIRAAATSADYKAALIGMLGQLRDPSCFVTDGTEPNPPAHPEGPAITWVHYGVHPAFLLADRTPEPVLLTMGAGIAVRLNLSEPATGPIPSPKPPAAKPVDADRPYPDVEYRILAAFQLWAAVRNFFAYRDLMDGDWDQYFTEFLPKFIAAGNEREYNLTVAAALTRVDDTNAKVKSADLDRYFGIAPVGLLIRLVEKKPVVAAILDEQAAKDGVKIGDVVASVDGEEIVARIRREIEFIPASTNQSLSIEVCKRLLNGPEDSTATLSLQSGNGTSRQVTLRRSTRFAALHPTQRPGDATRFLSKAIGYVDLEKVNGSQLDFLFEKFSKMTAIIFDLRGPIGIEPALLASRLTEKSDSAAAIVTGPISLTPDLPSAKTLTQTASFFRVETFPGNPRKLYKGKTIAVIDERTLGGAEHLGLLMEAANNTVFVGSQSAGADGEVTEFALPGRIAISFSTTDVRHGNGGKLQRLGLQPMELVTPTVHSIRAGTDETLEKAIESVSR